MSDRSIVRPLWLAGLLVVAVWLPLALGRSALEPEPEQGAKPAVQKLRLPGIENAYRLSARLYSGGQPEGPAAFEALQKLGVRTVVSVDGSPTDVASARAHGLRYVHLPIGYDGLSPERVAALVQVAREADGPVFVHCHHGKHRGPAAAAICGLGTGVLTPEAAQAWLQTAGTDPRYSGLYRDVARFTAPDAAALAALGPDDLPERATVPDRVAAMVAVDATFDRLKAIRAAGYGSPADQPDLDPAHEALQLAEHLRETDRLTTPADADRSRLFQSADAAATELEALLRRLGPDRSERARQQLDAAFDRVARSCTDCHARHRDRRDDTGPR